PDRGRADGEGTSIHPPVAQPLDLDPPDDRRGLVTDVPRAGKMGPRPDQPEVGQGRRSDLRPMTAMPPGRFRRLRRSRIPPIGGDRGDTPEGTSSPRP